MQIHIRICTLLILFIGSIAYSSELAIESIERNGRLTFSPLPTSAVYRVEWAPAPDGPWSTSWSGNRGIAAEGESVLQVDVPMIYRVLAETGRPDPSRIIIVGDSLTAQNQGITYHEAIGYFSWAQGFCTYPVHLEANMGVGGGQNQSHAGYHLRRHRLCPGYRYSERRT